MGSALPITYFNKSHYADIDGRLAERRPSQLTRGHANNLGQQGGDDCSESKIDLPIYSYGSPPPLNVCSQFFIFKKIFLCGAMLAGLFTASQNEWIMILSCLKILTGVCSCFMSF